MSKPLRLLSLVCSFALAPLAHAASAPVPMVDGHCTDYPQGAARQVAVAPGVTLHVYEDEHYVWMCYTYPEGSMGMLDMTLSTPALAAPLNLHVSAQLGEWPAGRDDLAPKGPESELWWNQRGWTGTTVPINGLDLSGAKPRFRFRNTPGRELQLAKQRFGSGEWKFSLTIYRVMDAGGKLHDIRFPAGGGDYRLPVR